MIEETIKEISSKLERHSKDLREAKKEYWEKQGNTRSISFMSALFLVFIALKLSGNIDWSWFIVCIPMYSNVIENLSLVSKYRNKTI